MALSGGAIAGIVLAVIVLVAAIAFFWYVAFGAPVSRFKSGLAERYPRLAERAYFARQRARRAYYGPSYKPEYVSDDDESRDDGYTGDSDDEPLDTIGTGTMGMYSDESDVDSNPGETAMMTAIGR